MDRDRIEDLSMMKGLVSIILPTTGRKDMAVKCINRLLRSVNEPIELICVIDSDTESEKSIRSLFLDWNKKFPYDRLFISYSENYRGIGRSFNDGLKISSGEYIVPASDDVWFDDRWLEAAMHEMKKFPEGGGMVALNDTHHNGAELATLFLASRWFICNCMNGVLFFECYKYWHSDIEATERAKRVGRYTWAKNSVVRHDHWAWGTRAEDDTDRLNKKFLDESAGICARRREAGWPDDFEPVIRWEE